MTPFVRNYLRELYYSGKDALQPFRRWRSPRPQGLSELGLSSSQIYPEGDHFDESLTEGLHQQVEKLSIDRRTTVASIGSCFAEEFADHMRKNGFNYMQEEKDTFRGSARWGRVYTVANFLQVVRYALEPSFPIWVESCQKGWFDPLREHSLPFYPDRLTAEAEIEAHRAAAKRVFRSAQILVITLGQNEAWKDNQEGWIWARKPPADLLRSQPKRFTPLEFSFEENKDMFKKAVDALLTANPAIRIILTISPVPAYATFLDSNGVTRAWAGKAVLRALVHDMVTRVYPTQMVYFPSFERVVADNPHQFMADNRHIKRHAVRRIFTLFDRVFVK